ncbi:unnamed protein product [Cylicocyclus nassatus]|uniref:Uncharacterized protein n=1 Tax=Cylicocyclus nassatus TaxID=53992 RepID=A0AA36H8D2_CYLNA|nr:unnamed protein product [Cylicocyclus nassatus]
MDESQSSRTSPARRLSMDSTTTSEFEVVSRERSPSGSTVEGDVHLDNVSLTEASSPNESINVPTLYSESTHGDQDLPPLGESIQMDMEAINVMSLPQPSWRINDDLLSLTTSASQMSVADSSEARFNDDMRETVGMLEQVFHQLAEIKGRNNLLEKTVEQANEWRNRADKLEEQNKILQKSLRSSKNKVEQFTREVEELKHREEKLSTSLREVEDHQTQKSTSYWYCRAIAVCIVAVAVILYMDCYAQLLKEQRSCQQLKEKLQLMNELVDKLEAEHAAEYKRRLEEISKQMADDMSASISEAHKQRELEHERLLEAYREKMILHDDLSALRKEKFHGKKKSSTWYR